MATFSLPFFFLTLSLLQNPLFTSANLHKSNLLTSKSIFQQDSSQLSTPTTFFQVTKPIKLPKTKPCSSLILQHDFGYTYGSPPITAQYRPPTHCPSQNFSKIVLEWRSTCKGRQFDRIFGVWLSGVVLLRSCTAEPRASGIVWTVEKDITRYSSLLKHPQTLEVYLGNIVDKTYTGIYHVNITLRFYPAEESNPDGFELNSVNPVGFELNSVKSSASGTGFGSVADLILPVSRNLPLNDGLWFLIENSSDKQSKEIVIPRNVYRAVLEVFVSFHSSDEVWYGNPPNEYIIANNLTGVPGNGPFREVVVYLDSKAVGAIWPFTVIYTGGVNPLLWRPITGIGSFDLPSYDIEITPFLGNILDGKSHLFSFGVTDALSYWYIDANLHLWLDSNSVETEGELVKYVAPPFQPFLVSKFKGLNGSFVTSASRHITSAGWVKSSYGNITTHSMQEFNYKNVMVFSENADVQVVNQTINADYGVFSKLPSSDFDLESIEVYQTFPLYLYTATVNQGNGSYSSISNVSLEFNEERFWHASEFGFRSSYLNNSQNGQGDMLVKGNLVTSGVGSTQEVYNYRGADCYFRKVSSSNYTILHDESDMHCLLDHSTGPKFGSDFGSGRWRPFPARRASLAFDSHDQKNRH